MVAAARADVRRDGQLKQVMKDPNAPAAARVGAAEMIWRWRANPR